LRCNPELRMVSTKIVLLETGVQLKLVQGRGYASLPDDPVEVLVLKVGYTNRFDATFPL